MTTATTDTFTAAEYVEHLDDDTRKLVEIAEAAARGRRDEQAGRNRAGVVATYTALLDASTAMLWAVEVAGAVDTDAARRIAWCRVTS